MYSVFIMSAKCTVNHWFCLHVKDALLPYTNSKIHEVDKQKITLL